MASIGARQRRERAANKKRQIDLPDRRPPGPLLELCAVAKTLEQAAVVHLSDLTAESGGIYALAPKRKFGSSMRVRNLFGWIGALLLMASPAGAQAYDPQMYNNQANIYLNGELNRITINTGTSGGGQRRTGQTPQVAPIQDRVMAAALEALRPELQRRWRVDGEGSARAWAVATAGDLGREMGRLMPEYRKRVATAGQIQADNWYLAAARSAGQRYGQ